MVKICMAGACGRMGRRILALAALEEGVDIGGAFDLEQHAGTVLTLEDAAGAPRSVTVSADAAAEIAHSDALIDFTLAEGCTRNVQLAAAAGKAAIVGTTGLSPAQEKELADCALAVPVVYAPNMSVGVNLLFKLTADVAAILGLDYNIEIVEAHHNQKKDSPSGTALRLAQRAAEGLGLDPADAFVHGRHGAVGVRPAREIGVHALRGGDVVGEHTVSFIGQGERVELTHKAHNRDNFARGALRAARFCQSAPPGLYDMQDVLGLR